MQPMWPCSQPCRFSNSAHITAGMARVSRERVYRIRWFRTAVCWSIFLSALGGTLEVNIPELKLT